MPYEVAYTQHHGKDRRFPEQQDALYNGVDLFQERDLAAAHYLFEQDVLTVAVADGVGKSPQPARASRLVLKAMAAELAQGTHFDGRLVRRMHGHLCDAMAKGKTFGAATTLAAAQCRENHCVIMNTGDSRVYHISASGTWRQLSHDHTMVNAMIARGEAEAGKEYASFYYVLDSCLVADDEDDQFDIHRAETAFLPGESLLLCTDGIHDTLLDAGLQRHADPALSPQEQIEVWRKAVLDAGAPDNLSMILIHHRA